MLFTNIQIGLHYLLFLTKYLWRTCFIKNVINNIKEINIDTQTRSHGLLFSAKYL